MVRPIWVAAIWALIVATGFAMVWRYSGTPGQGSTAPMQWPQGTRLELSARQPTVIMFVHPRCPCSRASLTELERLVAKAPAMSVTVVFVHPHATEWGHGELWDRAARIPAILLFEDADAAEAQRFGVETSGATLLYGQGGRLLFAGGLTASRGHEGAAEGQTKLLAALQGRAVDPLGPVFGCALK